MPTRSSITAGVAALLDAVRDGIVERVESGADPTTLFAGPAAYAQFHAVKAREAERGIRITVLGLFLVEDPRAAPNDLVVT